MISNPGHTFLDVNTKYSGNPFQLTFYLAFPTTKTPTTTALTHATNMASHCEVCISAPYDSEYTWIPGGKFPYDHITRSLTTATKLPVWFSFASY